MAEVIPVSYTHLLLTEGVGYTFDEDIKTQVSAQDHDSVLNVYRTNFDNVVKKEMEQVLISFTAGNTQYPININNPIAEAMVCLLYTSKKKKRLKMEILQKHHCCTKNRRVWKKN